MGRIEGTVDVDRPVAVVYERWSRFEDFPRFMNAVISVTRIDTSRLHWVARIGGVQEQWTAEITQQIPDHFIAWRGFAGPENLGSISFVPIESGTRLTVQIDYEFRWMVEKIGDSLGILERRVRADLARFKVFVEDHE